MEILEADLLQREADKRKVKAKAIADQALRDPAALMDSADGAGQITREQERQQFFKSNPVMQRMELDQAAQGLSPQEIPVVDAQVPRADDPRAVESAIEIAEVSPTSNVSPEGLERLVEEAPQNVLSRAARLPQATGTIAPQFDRTGMNLANQGFKMMEDGIAMEAGAQAAQLENEAKALEAKAQEIQSINKSAQEQQEAVAAKQREVFDKALKFNEEMKTRQIDTDRFWNSRDTGQKAMLTLGIFLMGVGGQDGLAQLNNLIDRDIAAQKEAFDRGMTANDNMVSIMSKLYGDEMAAISGAKAMALENLMSKLEAKMASTKSAEVRAKVPKLIGAMKVEQGKLLNNIAVEVMKAQATNSTARKIPQEAAKHLSLAIDGVKSLQDVKRAFQKNSNRRDRFSLFGDNEYTAAREIFVESLARLNTGAAITKSEEERFSAMVPTWRDKASIGRLKLRNLERMMANKLKLFEQSAGITQDEITGGNDFGSRVRIVE